MEEVNSGQDMAALDTNIELSEDTSSNLPRTDVAPTDNRGELAPLDEFNKNGIKNFCGNEEDTSSNDSKDEIHKKTSCTMQTDVAQATGRDESASSGEFGNIILKYICGKDGKMISNDLRDELFKENPDVCHDHRRSHTSAIEHYHASYNQQCNYINNEKTVEEKIDEGRQDYQFIAETKNYPPKTVKKKNRKRKCYIELKNSDYYMKSLMELAAKSEPMFFTMSAFFKMNSRTQTEKQKCLTNGPWNVKDTLIWQYFHNTLHDIWVFAVPFHTDPPGLQTNPNGTFIMTDVREAQGRTATLIQPRGPCAQESAGQTQHNTDTQELGTLELDSAATRVQHPGQAQQRHNRNRRNSKGTYATNTSGVPQETEEQEPPVDVYPRLLECRVERRGSNQTPEIRVVIPRDLMENIPRYTTAQASTVYHTLATTAGNDSQDEDATNTSHGTSAGETTNNQHPYDTKD